jgi:hypothetical protein
MTRISLSLALLAALSPLVNAGVKFTSPKAGEQLTAGTAVTVKWEEGGTGPKLTDLTTYTLQLIVGGNEGAEQVGCHKPLIMRYWKMLTTGHSS